jgi:hypothetical protein
MPQDALESAAAFRSRMAGHTFGRAPALAIAHFVRENGAVYSSEILDRFFLSESTLRRRLDLGQSHQGQELLRAARVHGRRPRSERSLLRHHDDRERAGAGLQVTFGQKLGQK